MTTSNLADFDIYAINYRLSEVEYDTDSTGLYISTINGINIYEDAYDTNLYMSYITIADSTNTYALSQDNQLLFLDNKTGYTDIVLSTNYKIYLYNNIKITSVLSNVKSSYYTVNISGLNIGSRVPIEVRFNSLVVKSYDYNPITGTLQFKNPSEIHYDYLNQIDMVFGNAVTDTSKINIQLDDISIKTLPKDYSFEDPELILLNKTIQENGVTINRIVNTDTYEDLKIKDGVTSHETLQNLKVEIDIKTIRYRANSSGSYGVGGYGVGLYGGGTRTINEFTQGNRFRLLFHNNITNEVIVYNNCKTKYDYGLEMENIYGLTLKIEANREIIKWIGEDIENNSKECVGLD